MRGDGEDAAVRGGDFGNEGVGLTLKTGVVAQDEGERVEVGEDVFVYVGGEWRPARSRCWQSR